MCRRSPLPPFFFLVSTQKKVSAAFISPYDAGTAEILSVQVGWVLKHRNIIAKRGGHDFDHGGEGRESDVEECDDIHNFLKIIIVIIIIRGLSTWHRQR